MSLLDRLRAARKALFQRPDEEPEQPLEGELAWADPLRLFPTSVEAYNPSVLVSRKGLRKIDEMLRDDQVRAALTFKKHAIISGGWNITSPEGRPDDWEPTVFAQEQLERLSGTFERATIDILTALEYGFSVTEKVFDATGDRIELLALKTRAPHSFVFVTDEFGNIESDGVVQHWRGDGGTERLPVRKFVLFRNDPRFGNPYGSPDVESAYRPWWAREQAYRFMMMMLERYGIPPIFALYNQGRYNNAQQDQLKTVLSRLQAATSGIIPRRQKDDLEMWAPENLAGQVSTVFIPALELTAKDIARGILMPGLLGVTPDDRAGSFARAKKHFDMFLLVVETLQRRLAEEAMNEQVIRPLVALNFPVDEFPVFRWMPVTDEIRIDLLDQWTALVGANIVQPTPDDERHIREMLEFPPRHDADDGADDDLLDSLLGDEETGDDSDVEGEFFDPKQPRWPSGTAIGGQWRLVGVKLTATKERAFSGAAADLGDDKLSKIETGEMGERIAVSYLRDKRGFSDADTLNVRRNNFSVDLVGDHEVHEVKAGLASNGRSAQQWRATLGQPGAKERAWLKTASAADKRQWNERKAQAVLQRKQKALSEFRSKTGKKVKGKTLAVIIDSKKKVADIYEFAGFHLRIGWTSDQAKKGYVGSFRYAD